MIYAHQENETQKLLLDFEIETEYQILARRPDLVIINNNNKKKKENLLNIGLCCPGWPRNKIKRKQKER